MVRAKAKQAKKAQMAAASAAVETPVAKPSAEVSAPKKPSLKKRLREEKSQLVAQKVVEKAVVDFGSDNEAPASKKGKKDGKKKKKGTKVVKVAEPVPQEQSTKPVIEEEVEESDEEGFPTSSTPSERPLTVSVALPASIVANAQSKELMAYLVGQIARALTVFGIDEVVIYEDQPSLPKEGECSKALSFFVRNLQYLETPQYLRRALFPMHSDLKFAGLQNPLDAPHHMRQSEWVRYREGVVMEKEPKGGCWVNVGLEKFAWIEQTLKPGLRVTVEMDPKSRTKEYPEGKAVSRTAPCVNENLYWGYEVRIAPSLRKALDDAPFEKGYDLILGTSENGEKIDAAWTLPQCKHLLVVFGALGGLEDAIEDDANVLTSDPTKLFHQYLNTCVDQKSRTIRTEEALLVTMSLMRPAILKAGGF